MSFASLPAEIVSRTEISVTNPAARRTELEKIFRLIAGQKFYGVVVPGARVGLAAAILAETPCKVTALVGHPHGDMDKDVKRYDTEVAVDNGAQEIEMVMNPGAFRDGAHSEVLREMLDIVEAADERPVKVILPAHFLNPEELILAAQLVGESGSKWVSLNVEALKTSALIEELHKVLPHNVGIKANFSNPITVSATASCPFQRLGWDPEINAMMRT